MLLRAVHLVSQDLSIAGKRAGLAGERSGLFMEQIRLIKEIRNGRTDDNVGRYMVFENVGGLFSSNKGEDFRTVLEETAKIADENARIPGLAKWPTAGAIMGDTYSLAWRLHDAQFWGVPQRRRRVCLVADFDGHTAIKLLFDAEYRGEADYRETFEAIGDTGKKPGSKVQTEREGVSGDPAESKTERERIAEGTAGGVGEASGVDLYNERMTGDKVIALTASMSKGVGCKRPTVLQKVSGIDLYNGTVAGDVAASITTATGQGAANSGPTVLCMATQQGGAEIMRDMCPTITAAAGMSGNNQPVICLNDQGGSVMEVSEDVTGTLRAQTHQHEPIVVDTYSVRLTSEGSKIARNEIKRTDVASSLLAETPRSDGNQAGIAVVETYDVRFTSDGTKNARGHCYKANIARSLDTGGCNPDSNHGGIAVVEKCYCLQGNGIDRADTAGCNDKGWTEDVSYTLNTIDRPAVAVCAGFCGGQSATAGSIGYQEEISPTLRSQLPCVYEKVVSIGNGQTNQISMDDKANTLDTMHDQQAIIVYGLDRAAYNQGQNAKYDFAVDDDLSAPYIARGPNAVAVKFFAGSESEVNGMLAADSMKSLNSNNCVRIKSVVRRITPCEEERLQGYPDGWTNIGEWIDSKGKKRTSADHLRYKALGNSIALPYWEWLAHRMVAQLREDGVENPTMGSLFSGIGGFELVFMRAGCKPIWNSEIDEFAKAVTKCHFIDEG